MNDPHPFDETVLAGVLECPTDAHATYLDEVCAGDAALRARIRGLLRAHNAAAGVTGQPGIQTAVSHLNAPHGKIR